MAEHGHPSLLTPPSGVYTRRTFLRMAGGRALRRGGVLAVVARGPLRLAAAKPLLGPVGGVFSLFTWAGYDGEGCPRWTRGTPTRRSS